MAIKNRNPSPGVVVHADHGVQFTSWAFTNRIKEAGLMPSFGSVGDGLDNAIDENPSGQACKSSYSIASEKKTRIELAYESPSIPA